MEALQQAINSVQQSELAFCKFITANDTGSTGGHQAGFHIGKAAWPLMFDAPGSKGSNKDKFITIRWQNDFETDSRFIYYGVRTRNEYRLTRFGRGFPFLGDENVGDLLILTKKSDDYYEGFVLSRDEEIDAFLEATNISSTNTNQIIRKQDDQFSDEQKLQLCFESYIQSLTIDFPSTRDIASQARECYLNSLGISTNHILSNPDKQIINWINSEYDLFKSLENSRYASIVQKPFGSVEALIETANTILNRRKSRAGKSLEHHLEAMFNMCQLLFQTQVTTENNKKPDFLFPSIEAYKNPLFSEEKLVVLASKTTCKDRWRQVLNEADRIKTKHLFTLQQGISKNQLEEMNKYGVQLVVPKPYLKSFPKEFQKDILTLDNFIGLIQRNQ
ncbi:MAG: restriction endonuclease [Flavobacteriales bacterium]|nr:restriction endonuclease [Flavobacteriales bacterium]